MPPIIQLFSVTKTYKIGKEKINALDQVSVNVAQGDFVAITGPSGSGKTTLAQVMGGLTAVTSGSVTVNDQRISDFPDRDLSAFRNKNVGFVFQNFALLPHYTALENVMIPLYVSGLKKGQRTEKAAHYLNLVDLSPQANRLANSLSGGQRQRVAIARALAMEPNILIADEPTGNLDSKNGLQIITILERLTRTDKMTVIMVTHDNTLAARASHRIHLKDGKALRART